MRILLLQARYRDDPAKEEEVRSFARATDLDESAFQPCDLLEGPPSLESIRRCDAMMVGGSGELYLSHGDLPDQDGTLDVLRRVVEEGLPTYASCFGYQGLVLALGGELVHDPESTELGTYELSLTRGGGEDELFGGLPERFQAQLGHKDRVAQPPPGTVNLASSELCAFQALRVPGKPVWASQFHPELDGPTNYGRFIRYFEGYAKVLSEEERARAHERFRESPETDRLLSRFLEAIAES